MNLRETDLEKQIGKTVIDILHQSDEVRKVIRAEATKLYKQMLKTTFTERKLTDTPTDDLQVVNRKYVNLYGSIASAPTGSVYGQQYFDTTNGYPIFKNQNSRWVNSVGSIIS